MTYEFVKLAKFLNELSSDDAEILAILSDNGASDDFIQERLANSLIVTAGLLKIAQSGPTEPPKPPGGGGEVPWTKGFWEAVKRHKIPIITGVAGLGTGILLSNLLRRD